jgi:hypothetical protein
MYPSFNPPCAAEFPAAFFLEFIKSPKSVAVPPVLITKVSIVFTVLPVSPPAAKPLTLFDKPKGPLAAVVKSP